VNDLARSEIFKFSVEVWGTTKMMGRSTKQSLKQQKVIFSMFRYGSVLVAQKYSAIQRALERKADIKIAQSRELAYRSVLRSHSSRIHEKTSIPYNQSRWVRINENGQTVPGHAKALQAAKLAPNTFPTLYAKSSTTNKCTQISMTRKKRRTTKTQELYDFA
jgi:hypothetical protein